MSEAAAMVRTRFAPSPSGHLHVGGARTALFCWAYARKHSGRFILRIEDTDRKRSSDEAARGFMEDLEWLGIGWDEGPEHGGFGGGTAGPYLQSQRLEIYRRYAEQLIAHGRASLDAGAVRFKVPTSGEVTFDDIVRGRAAIDVAELDDFVIMKSDGYPTYHFAVVVDDELMSVTHVLRGEEHFKNTFRHVLLQSALGFRRPAYAHLSLIFNPDGSKMSKRDRDKALRRAVSGAGLTAPPPGIGDSVPIEAWRRWLADEDLQLDAAAADRLAEALGVSLPEIEVEDFRRAGYLPGVLVNYLALLGWSPGGDVETFDRDWFLERFDLDRIIKSPARFDREKLKAFNLAALQALDPAEFARLLRAHCERSHRAFLRRLGEDRFDLFAACNQSRSKTLDDPVRSCRFLVIDDGELVYEQSKAVAKALAGGSPSGMELLEGVAEVLAGVTEWTLEPLERAVTAFAEDRAGGKLGRVAQPLRIAVSGSTISPAIFETLVLVGRDSTLRRIERCLKEHHVTK